MQDSLIEQGINLMLYGMGTVFVFLTILVLATGLMSKLVRLVSPDDAETPANAAPASATTLTPIGQKTQPDGNTIAAIKQAIALHRKR